MTDTNQEVRETPEALTFTYTNWRGETAERRIDPTTAKFCFDGNEWHPDPQWLLTAVDLDKGELRGFAWNRICLAPPPAVPDAVGVRATRLTWDGDYRAASADPTSGISYWIGPMIGFCEEWKRYRAAFNGVEFGSDYLTLEAAQAAAQADFDRRILSSIEPTPSPELRRFANCVQCGRIVDTREKSAGGDAYGCEVGADRWVCSFECYETELGGTPSPEPQAAGCMCRDVPIGSHKVSVLMELPEHMASVQVARLRDGLSPYITVDSCLVEEIRDLWSKGITTTGCCCGHNRAQGFIGVASQDIRVMKAMGYIVAPNASRPGDEDSFVPKSIRSEPQASNSGAVETRGRFAHYDNKNLAGQCRMQAREALDPDLEAFMLAVSDRLLADAAALSTPEPQTGERDGDEAQKIREGLAKERHRGDGSLEGQINYLVASLVAWMRTARTVELAANADREALEAAERRFAEVEERAREDERDRLYQVSFDGMRAAERDRDEQDHELHLGAFVWLKSFGAMLPADRAALRAKPEAQAIVGKEAGE